MEAVKPFPEGEQLQPPAPCLLTEPPSASDGAVLFPNQQCPRAVCCRLFGPAS